MEKIKVRVPYRKFALGKGYCNLDEGGAFNEFIEKLAGKMRGCEGFRLTWKDPKEEWELKVRWSE